MIWIQSGSSTSHSPTKKNSSRVCQLLGFQLIPNVAKLTIKISHHSLHDAVCMYKILGLTIWYYITFTGRTISPALSVLQLPVVRCLKVRAREISPSCQHVYWCLPSGLVQAVMIVRFNGYSFNHFQKMQSHSKLPVPLALIIFLSLFRCDP